MDDLQVKIYGQSVVSCFAESQGVVSVGQLESSQFSTSKEERIIFSIVKSYSNDVYLLARIT